MVKKKLINFFLVIALFFSSINIKGCLAVFIPAEDNHQKIFELLYQDMQKFYAYSDEIKSFNGNDTLQEIYDEFQNKLSKKKLTQIEFAFFLKDFENRIADPHFYFNFGQQMEDKIINEYNNPYQSLQEDEGIVVTGDLFSSQYIDYIKQDTSSPYFYGTIKKQHSGNKNIGYIIINNIIQELSGSSRFGGNRKWLLEIEEIITKFNNMKIESIIIDIRTSAGGSQDNGRFIASRFANRSERVYLIADERINDKSFKRSKLTVAPEGNGFRKRKIILLANATTCSGGEMFTLALRQRTNTIHVGANTDGCTGGIIARDLANGWQVTMTSSKTYYPNPKDDNDLISYFRKGIPPDDKITYGDDDYNKSIDKEILRALELLKDDNLFRSIYQNIERY